MDPIIKLLNTGAVPFEDGTDYVSVRGHGKREIVVTESPDTADEYVVAMYLNGFELLEWDVMAEVPADKVLDTIVLFLETEYVGD